MPAFTATQAQQAVGQEAAFEEGVKFVFDELRPAGTRCRLSLLEEGGGVLLYLAVRRGLLWAVALIVNRGAVRRPDRRIGLPANGLRASVPRW